MRRSSRRYRTPRRGEKGAGTTEYVLGIAGIALVAGLSISKVGHNVGSLFSTSSNAAAGSGVMEPTETDCAGEACAANARSGCFVAGTPIDTAEGSKAIEQVLLGDRVGPAECQSLRTDDWQEVSLRMPAEVDIHLLRPPIWLAQHRASVGSEIEVSLEEMNLEGTALVTGIREGPKTTPGSRCPITGLMRHTSREVMTLALQGGSVLGVTRSHPLFSADRLDWVQAGDLLPGEKLVTQGGVGQVAGVSDVSKEPREVFNLEVAEAHRYFVGAERVLAHNQCIPWLRRDNSNLSKYTYRGDSRPAAEIFNDGFKTRGKSNNLLAHARDNTAPPSNYVSTSKSYDVANSFNGDSIYVVRPRHGKDVNATLGPNSPYPAEQEVAVKGRVKPEDIRAVTLPQWDRSMLNPNWKPRKRH